MSHEVTLQMGPLLEFTIDENTYPPGSFAVTPDIYAEYLERSRVWVAKIDEEIMNACLAELAGGDLGRGAGVVDAPAEGS